MDILTESYSRPGRIHHCMRSIGAAQNALDTMLRRVTDPKKKTFGKYLHEHGMISSIVDFGHLDLILFEVL